MKVLITKRLVEVETGIRDSANLLFGFYEVDKILTEVRALHMSDLEGCGKFGTKSRSTAVNKLCCGYAVAAILNVKQALAMDNMEQALESLTKAYYFFGGVSGGENALSEKMVQYTESLKNKEWFMHKKEFQALAVSYKDSFSTLSELKKLNIREFQFYFDHYSKGHTLHDWINEVLPGHLKKGRPPKN